MDAALMDEGGFSRKEVAGVQGLSIANNLLANQVQYNLDKNQGSLRNTVTQLSSGLRINSAADDPSGLAIATNLQTQVDGFQTASQNVQDANNAVQVAEGALATETGILQRMRNIAAEAASDVNSSSDRSNLQAEITQLITEVNRISQNTNFNGQPLLDGSHAGFQAAVTGAATITSNAVLASAGGGVTVTNANMANPPQANNSISSVLPTGWTASGTGSYGVYNGNDGGVDITLPAGQQAAFVQQGETLSQTVTGLAAGAQYTLSYQAGTINGATLQVSANGTAISTPALNNTFQTYTATFTANGSGQATIAFTETTGAGKWVDFTNVSIAPVAAVTSGTATLISSVGAANVNAFITTAAGTAAADGTIEVQVVNNNGTAEADATFYDSATGTTLSATGTSGGTITLDNVTVTLGAFTLSDAGQTGYVKVSQYVAQSSGTGAFTVQSGADEGDTVQIGVQATNAQTLRISNVNVTTQLGAEDTIGQLDNALDTLLKQRAQLGAVIVRLNEDADNDNVASVNLRASESAIRDLNVGQATTEFTKLQVLVQVGTSVLAQSNSNADSVLGLFR